MDASSVGVGTAPRVFATRRQATAEAKALILKSGVQSQLGEEQGGFVWHVEKWPNWLQVSVDVLGNAHSEEAPAKEEVTAWYKERDAQIKEMFAGVLGDQFGEIVIIAKPMGQEAHVGGCCRTGCGGCMNGPHNKLLSKIQGTTPTDPVDRLG